MLKAEFFYLCTTRQVRDDKPYSKICEAFPCVPLRKERIPYLAPKQMTLPYLALENLNFLI
jgi:hypothetical protein